MKQLLLLCVFANLVVLTALGQRTMTANVVDVLDGRTVVMEVAGGRVNAQLQYVETPEPEQALHKVVKDHLGKLVIGKAVEFKMGRMIAGKTVGRVTLDGVDLSAQLIRDGAAWHEPKESSGQPADEAAQYEAHQTAAKNEKLGVWSVTGLKAPWVVRAEKEQQQRALESARRIAKPTLVGLGEYQSDTRRPSGQHTAAPGISQRIQMDNWVSVFAESGKESYGILTYTDPRKKFTAVYTSAAMLDFSSGADKERVEFRAMMVSPTVNDGGRSRAILLAFQAISSGYRFSKGKSRPSVIADGKIIPIGTPFGFRREGLIGAQEVAIYRISWATLRKIGYAKKVEVRMDKRTAPMSESSRDLFKQLADATG